MFDTVAKQPQSKQIGYSNRIIGGVDALAGEFPYIVSIHWVFLTISTHMCGGSILGQNYVLTAAHCITEAPSTGRFEIRSGILRQGGDSNEQRLGTLRTVIHPDYAGGVGPNDIAVFITSGMMTWTNFVQPVTLPERGHIASGPVILIGWGATSGGTIPTLPDVLQKVIKPIVPIDECFAAIPGTPLADTNVCTGPLTGGISACSGDSGGPVMRTTTQGSELVGVVSWGFTPCGSEGAPSVHVRVSAFIDWIEANRP